MTKLTVKASDFIGLSKKTAQSLAENKNLIFRLISVNKEKFFDYPEDIRDDRVCVEIVDDKVVKCKIQ